MTKISPILVTIIPSDSGFFFVTNFSENSSDLKKLVSFWVKKISPILVTIIPFDFGYFCHQNWRKFNGITKIGDNFVENQCGLIYAKMFTIFCEHFGDLNFLLNFRQIVHQCWWKFWWFDEIGEFLSDKNITNSGDNNSFRFWVFLSPILVKSLVNWRNWWVFKWQKFHQF